MILMEDLKMTFEKNPILKNEVDWNETNEVCGRLLQTSFNPTKAIAIRQSDGSVVVVGDDNVYNCVDSYIEKRHHYLYKFHVRVYKDNNRLLCKIFLTEKGKREKEFNRLLNLAILTTGGQKHVLTDNYYEDWKHQIEKYHPGVYTELLKKIYPGSTETLIFNEYD